MPDLVELRRYRWRHEAEVAQGLLEDAGIGALILADDAGGALGGFGLPTGQLPVRLLVREEDLDAAREALPEDSDDLEHDANDLEAHADDLEADADDLEADS